LICLVCSATFRRRADQGARMEKKMTTNNAYLLNSFHGTAGTEREASVERATAVGETIANALVGLGALGFKAVRTYENWRLRQAAKAELRSLDDRQLADMGLTRCDIESVLEGIDARTGKPANENVAPANMNGVAA